MNLGKSRADLWALAAITAVEHGIQTTNLVCDEKYNNNPGKQCNAFIGTEHVCIGIPSIPMLFPSNGGKCTYGTLSTYSTLYLFLTACYRYCIEKSLNLSI